MTKKIDLSNKKKTLTERGEWDEANGDGRVPNREDFPLPNWLKKKKNG